MANMSKAYRAGKEDGEDIVRCIERDHVSRDIINDLLDAYDQRIAIPTLDDPVQEKITAFLCGKRDAIRQWVAKTNN